MVNFDFIVDKSVRSRIERIYQKILTSMKSNKFVYTDFLDPYERTLVKTFIKYPLSYYEDGGYFEAERKILQIYPEYMESKNLVQIIKIDSKNKITHREILGSVMGLGLVREKIGDIVSNGDLEHYIVVTNELVNYIMSNLKKVGNNNVSLTLSEDVKKSGELFSYKDLVIKSKRLDLFLSKAFSINRNLSKSYIEHGLCKVNFMPITNPSYLLSENDLISLRKYGRCYFDEILNTTKKDNILVRVKFPL